MAKIRHMTQTYHNSISKFLGVNESPTGDNDLKNGEAVEMDNYRVTLDGKLEIRPGTETVFLSTEEAPVISMWSGYLNGETRCLCAQIINDGVYLVEIVDGSTGGEWVYITESTDDNYCHIFNFQNMIYILSNGGYFTYDPDTLSVSAVEGYVPLVVTACSPDGGGTELEGLNVLSDSYRVQFSPDGESTDFYLPVTGNQYIESATLEGVNILESYNCFYDVGENCITMSMAPARGTNTLEIQMKYFQSLENLSYKHIDLSTNGSSGMIENYGVIDLTTQAAVAVDEEASAYYWYLTWNDPDFAGISEIEHTSRMGMSGESSVTTYGVQILENNESMGAANYRVHFNPETGDVCLAVLYNFSCTVTEAELAQYRILFDYYLTPSDSTATNAGIVTSMRESVLFNGVTDSRVFLYGDGTFTCIYSGLDENGAPRADYFPALYQANVGVENSPITGMVRHYNSLLAFKPNEAYRMTYESQTLSDSSVIAGFNIRPIHANIGTLALRQAVLVYNNPRTLCHNSIYEWRLSYYTSASNRDERNAKRVSDRVKNTLEGMDLSACWCWDDETRYEYWVTDGSTAIINNYANDTWYIYTGLDVNCMCRFGGELYLGGNHGVCRMTDEVYTDSVVEDGERTTEPIAATWKGCCFDAKHDYMNKWVIDQYVGLLNQEDNHVRVSMETDRESAYPVWVAEADPEAATPTVHHVKMRAKAWAFARLKLANIPGKPSTVVSLNTDYRLGSNGRRT